VPRQLGKYKGTKFETTLGAGMRESYEFLRILSLNWASKNKLRSLENDGKPVVLIVVANFKPI